MSNPDGFAHEMRKCLSSWSPNETSGYWLVFGQKTEKQWINFVNYVSKDKIVFKYDMDDFDFNNDGQKYF